jgi:hypothetical protein
MNFIHVYILSNAVPTILQTRKDLNFDLIFMYIL